MRGEVWLDADNTGPNRINVDSTNDRSDDNDCSNGGSEKDDSNSNAN
eukprot:gene17559-4021_t